MDIDQHTAAALGWPKLKYAWVERERRWLCRELPRDLVQDSERITDLYVTGTRLRLREAVPLNGGPPMRRLGRKADVNASVRLLTSMYLAPEEFELLSALPGKVLRKTRHRLGKINGVDVSVRSVRRFANRLADGLNLPRKRFTCGGVCHGTFTQWYNHNFNGKAVTVEYGAHPGRHRMRVRAPRQLVRVLGGHY